MVQISDPGNRITISAPGHRIVPWGSCFHLNGLLPTLAKSITHFPPEIPTGI